MIKLTTFSLLFSVLGACATSAHDYRLGPIKIDHPHARATLPAASTGAGYLKLSNSGKEDDALVSASSPVADKVQIHQIVLKEDIASMRAVAGGIEVPAGQTVELERGGYHLMFVGLKNPLKEAERIPVVLTFRKAGEIEVEFAIEGHAETEDASGEHAHH